MNAIFAHGPKDIRLQSCDSDDMGAGQVRVRMIRGGICGSDLHYFNHGGFGDVRLREPMILGHEVAGEVIEIATGVNGFELGDLVAISPSRPCGNCSYCLAGLPNHCLNMRFYGSAMPFPHIQGAFRSELVIDATQAVVANGLDAEQAAMAEPLAVCLHAVSRAGPLVGKTVLITGCGPIGVLCILAARRAGAARIIAVDITDRALGYAQAAGADIIINSLNDPDVLSELSQQKGQVDVLMECSGAEPALRAGIAALRPRGVIVQLGLGGAMSLPMMQITAKELELRGSFRFHTEFAHAVDYMRKGLIDVRPLVTHRFALSDFQTAFETASDKSQSMKVQIEF